MDTCATMTLRLAVEDVSHTVELTPAQRRSVSAARGAAVAKPWNELTVRERWDGWVGGRGRRGSRRILVLVGRAGVGSKGMVV